MIFIVWRHSKWGICAKGSPKTTKNLKPWWYIAVRGRHSNWFFLPCAGGILTEWFFAVRGPHSNWGGGIFGIRGGILTFTLTVYIWSFSIYVCEYMFVRYWKRVARKCFWRFTVFGFRKISCDSARWWNLIFLLPKKKLKAASSDLLPRSCVRSPRLSLRVLHLGLWLSGLSWT